MTFQILHDGKAIKCLICGMTSHHPKDVEFLYCSNCQRWHRVPDPVFLTDLQHIILEYIGRGPTVMSNIPVVFNRQTSLRILRSLYERGLFSLSAKPPFKIEITPRGIMALQAYESPS